MPPPFQPAQTWVRKRYQYNRARLHMHAGSYELAWSLETTIFKGLTRRISSRDSEKWERHLSIWKRNEVEIVYNVKTTVRLGVTVNRHFKGTFDLVLLSTSCTISASVRSHRKMSVPFSGSRFHRSCARASQRHGGRNKSTGRRWQNHIVDGEEYWRLTVTCRRHIADYLVAASSVGSTHKH